MDIGKLTNIIENFYKNPSKDDYKTIKNNGTHLAGLIGVDVYLILLFAMRNAHPILDNKLNTKEQKTLDSLESRLMNSERILTPKDLDTLWTLYYATGNIKYPNRVLAVSKDEKQSFVTREGAGWSYHSHLTEGKIPNPN